MIKSIIYQRIQIHVRNVQQILGAQEEHIQHINQVIKVEINVQVDIQVQKEVIKRVSVVKAVSVVLEKL